MKTEISKNNPFGYNRYGFAFEHICDNTKVLDYGCYDGKFISKISAVKNSVECIGLDKNKDIVDKNPYNQQIILQKDQNIPFDNKTFNIVSILDVIEHIHEQHLLLGELNRILKLNGKLIITSPKKHIFSFLDPGNLKFIFPNIHKIYYVLRYGKEAYSYRYLNNPSGLIGDVEKEKAWHEHFSEKEMKELLNCNGFEVEIFDGSGLFSRIFDWLSILGIHFLIPKFILKLDSKLFRSTHLFCLAIKTKEL